VVAFSDGKTLNVKNGRKGGTGATGATGPKPVKGVDYWTTADQEAIVQDVIAALGTPVFGRVDADNNIILTGELADGKYTIKYEDADGNVTEIGEMERGATYTNLFVADTCQLNKRTNSSGNVSDNVGGFLTDYIDLGDAMASGGTNVLHYKGLYFYATNLKNSQYAIATYFTYYDANKTCIKSVVQTDVVDVLSDKGDYIKTFDASYTNARYIRIAAVLVPNPSTMTTIVALVSKDQLANCKIALNETITD
jgi:hypothetical protein